ncbi:TetR/AcrR family transcriptional regulator [Streptomyces sp. CC77]|uniref:TetR/AcrR family transcriptional regulator n=1 Tax=Streptomyces sp. CC77 TaxID=1906739 RepID=UPI0020C8BAA0|nr:helix-turn-helix domain-containing protein [Streptomyces sp. CC77]
MHMQDSHGQARTAMTHVAPAMSSGNTQRGIGTPGAGTTAAPGVRSTARSMMPTGATGAVGTANTAVTGDTQRPAPLRVDAQRNLEHVLRAAREVFGELGYGAPMEDVARRARVGVGTVYRRFPSKDVLVRRIAEEETARLTEQARTALGQEDEPWSALARFLRTSVASGAGRLLPPQVLRVGVDVVDAHETAETRHGQPADPARVPQQRHSFTDGTQEPADLRVVAPRPVPAAEPEHAGAADLLDVVGQLVRRAREAGQLRRDVTVGDVLLVIATAAPSLPDAAQQSAAAARLLDIMLEGLRSRPA